jgi:hypothetical protein
MKAAKPVAKAMHAAACLARMVNQTVDLVVCRRFSLAYQSKGSAKLDSDTGMKVLRTRQTRVAEANRVYRSLPVKRI